jgi:hypothetical protein
MSDTPDTPYPHQGKAQTPCPPPVRPEDEQYGAHQPSQAPHESGVPVRQSGELVSPKR